MGLRCRRTSKHEGYEGQYGFICCLACTARALVRDERWLNGLQCSKGTQPRQLAMRELWNWTSQRRAKNSSGYMWQEGYMSSNACELQA